MFLIGSIRLSSRSLKRVNIPQFGEIYDFYFHFDQSVFHPFCHSTDPRSDPSKFNRNVSHSFMLQPLCLNCGTKLRRVLIGTSREEFSVNVELKYFSIHIYRREIF